MRFVIGLDVGTTGTKAVVCDENGTVFGKGYREYDLTFGNAGEVEQDAEDWHRATVFAIHRAIEEAKIPPQRVEAISLSTQGASMLAVDEAFRPLTNVMTWMDHRATEETEALCRTVGEERLYRASGWKPGPAYDSSKILWLRRHRPEVFGKAGSYVTTLEYMNRYLTGRNASDPTNAAIRILYDIEKREYDREILDAVGIFPAQLPEILPTGAFLGTLTKEAAEELGLSAEVRVFNGAHDQYCASLGAGAVARGDMMVATGTAWVVLGMTDRLIYSDSHVSPGIHPVPGLYGAMATLISAGSGLKWYRNLIGEDYSALDAGAAERRDRAGDLFFAPYLAGAGFPHTGEELSRLVGLKLSHDRYDIARALMEGVAFEVRTVLDEYEKLGCPVQTLYMTGRTAHSSLWRGLVRDITGCEILVSDEADTCCVGAAMIAMRGIGAYPDLASAAKGMSKITLCDKPQAENVAFYRKKYQRYQAILH